MEGNQNLNGGHQNQNNGIQNGNMQNNAVESTTVQSNSIQNGNMQNNAVESNLNVVSLKKMFIRFSICFIVLEILASLIIGVIESVIFGKNGFIYSILNLFYNDTEIALILLGDSISLGFIVLYAITFVYYFIYAYLAARFAFHDTFLKKRVIDANDKAKFTKLIVFLLPLLYVVITVLFNLITNEDFSTFSMFFQLHTIALLIVRFVSMSLAIYINKKRIKTN